jgi:hypothetical protein
MSVRKQILSALITAVLAMATMAVTASAQCGGAGAGGSLRINIAVSSDQGWAMPSYNLDLFSRFRTALSLYSWGRGPVGQPGTVRSSYAVLRERLGLMR